MMKKLLLPALLAIVLGGTALAACVYAGVAVPFLGNCPFCGTQADDAAPAPATATPESSDCPECPDCPRCPSCCPGSSKASCCEESASSGTKTPKEQ
jgi:hypothetical protein